MEPSDILAYHVQMLFQNLSGKKAISLQESCFIKATLGYVSEYDILGPVHYSTLLPIEALT